MGLYDREYWKRKENGERYENGYVYEDGLFYEETGNLEEKSKEEKKDRSKKGFGLWDWVVVVFGLGNLVFTVGIIVFFILNPGIALIIAFFAFLGYAFLSNKREQSKKRLKRGRFW